MGSSFPLYFISEKGCVTRSKGDRAVIYRGSEKSIPRGGMGNNMDMNDCSRAKHVCGLLAAGPRASNPTLNTDRHDSPPSV